MPIEQIQVHCTSASVFRNERTHRLLTRYGIVLFLFQLSNDLRHVGILVHVKREIVKRRVVLRPEQFATQLMKPIHTTAVLHMLQMAIFGILSRK